MCRWTAEASLYQEVGTSPPDARYFTLENVQGSNNQTHVRIHSINGSFADTTALLISFSAQLIIGSLTANAHYGSSFLVLSLIGVVTSVFYFAFASAERGSGEDDRERAFPLPLPLFFFF